MLNKKCKKQHRLEWQQICMADRWKCKLFSLAYIESYCPICNKGMIKWFLYSEIHLFHRLFYKFKNKDIPF